VRLPTVIGSVKIGGEANIHYIAKVDNVVARSLVEVCAIFLDDHAERRCGKMSTVPQASLTRVS